MSSVRRSLAFSLADTYLGLLLQLASSLVIARVLTPAEIGVFSVAAVLAALASSFRDFGVAEYLIQEPDLTPARIRAAYAANLIVSWLMAALLWGLSGPAADFYGEPGVGEVARILACNFVLIPFSAVRQACYRRELNYRPMFISGLAANLAGFAVAVGGALNGLGYLSLAWSSLCAAAVTLLVMLFFRPPGFPTWPGFAGLGAVLHFGKHATAVYLFGQLGRSAPEAVIGRVLDMASVAYFSRASGLLELFDRSVLRAAIPVCLPYFAQAARRGARDADGYLHAVRLLTGIGWPFFVGAGIAAAALIRLLFGPQWGASVALAQILCLAAVVQLPYALAVERLIADGRVELAHRLQIEIQVARLLGLVPVFWYGLTGACWGLVGGTLLGAALTQRVLRRAIGLRLDDLAAACLPSAGVALLAALPLALVGASGVGGELALLWLGGPAAALAWLAALRLFGHPFWPELQLLFARLRDRRANSRRS